MKTLRQVQAGLVGLVVAAGMAHGAAEVVDLKGRVRFTFRPGTASTVHVAGSFNGWACDDAWALTDPDRDGLFEGTFTLADAATLALVTNALADVQRARLARLGLEPLFRAVVISTEVGAAKPDARIFDAAFARLGDPPRASAVMVGDGLGSDMRGGASYGLATCWYNPARAAGGGRADVTHEVADLAELPELVRVGRAARPAR